MGKEPIIIVGGEPNSIFLEIFFKSLKSTSYKSPLINLDKLFCFIKFKAILKVSSM